MVSALDREGNVGGRGVSRSLLELQILALTFLKKLSILKENVAELADLGVVATLQKLAGADLDPDVATGALRLLLNLSFSSAIRDAIVKAPAILTLAVKVRPSSLGR